MSWVVLKVCHDCGINGQVKVKQPDLIVVSAERGVFMPLCRLKTGHSLISNVCCGSRKQ